MRLDGVSTATTPLRLSRRSRSGGGGSTRCCAPGAATSRATRSRAPRCSGTPRRRRGRSSRASRRTLAPRSPPQQHPLAPRLRHEGWRDRARGAAPAPRASRRWRSRTAARCPTGTRNPSTAVTKTTRRRCSVSATSRRSRCAPEAKAISALVSSASPVRAAVRACASGARSRILRSRRPGSRTRRREPAPSRA